MNQQFIARYSNTEVTAHSFAELGDLLIAKGFVMHRAHSNGEGPGVLLVPHAKSPRVVAKVTTEVEPKVDIPLQADVAAAMLVGAEVMAGFEGGAKLATRDCGSVHPDGQVCTVTVYAEAACCERGTERVFPHDGPHQVVNQDGKITHRWVEEMVVTELPFDSYGELEVAV